MDKYIDKETFGIIITAVSALISTTAIVVSYRIFSRTIKENSKPVLVFTSRGDGAGRWKLQNYGNGPALNVLVAEGESPKQWVEIVNCYPLSAGASVDLVWLKAAGALCATYSNIYGEQFTSICYHNQTQIINKNKFSEWKVNNHEWTETLLAKNRKYINEDDLEGYKFKNESDLEDCNKFQIDTMRNLPYAKHGYIFKRQDLQEHFSKQSWYKPLTNDKKEVEAQLTEKEKSISQFLLIYQHKRKVKAESNND